MSSVHSHPIPNSRRGGLKMAFSPFLDRAALRGSAIVAQMADDLRTFAANAGSVTDADLELLGWTPAQIASHGRDATRRAHARSAG